MSKTLCWSNGLPLEWPKDIRVTRTRGEGPGLASVLALVPAPALAPLTLAAATAALVGKGSSASVVHLRVAVESPLPFPSTSAHRFRFVPTFPSVPPVSPAEADADDRVASTAFSTPPGAAEIMLFPLLLLHSTR